MIARYLQLFQTQKSWKYNNYQSFAVNSYASEQNQKADDRNLKQSLTFPPLPFLHDGLQPLLFFFWGVRHADKPLVLGCVVDLPAVVHNVPAAVVVSCKVDMEGTPTKVIMTQSFIAILFPGMVQQNTLFDSQKLFLKGDISL